MADVIEQIDISNSVLIHENGQPAHYPDVPKNYLVFRSQVGIYTCPPPDKRKSRGRVNEDRPKFFLMEDPSTGEFEWVPENDYNTRPMREFMLRQGLEMEIKFPGMKMTAKAPKCSTIIRQEYGMVGTPLSLYMQFCRFRKQKIDTKLAEQALKEGKTR